MRQEEFYQKICPPKVREEIMLSEGGKLRGELIPVEDNGVFAGYIVNLSRETPSPPLPSSEQALSRKAILVDLDDTLILSTDARERFTEELQEYLRESYGFEIDKEKLLEIIWKIDERARAPIVGVDEKERRFFFPEAFVAGVAWCIKKFFAKGQLPSKEDLTQLGTREDDPFYYTKNDGVVLREVDESEYKEILNIFVDKFVAEVELDQKLIEILNKLASLGYEIIILTAGNPPYQLSKALAFIERTKLPIRQIWSTVHPGGKGKFIRAAIAKLAQIGLFEETEEMVVIDDNPDELTTIPPTIGNINVTRVRIIRGKTKENATPADCEEINPSSAEDYEVLLKGSQ